MSTKTVHNYRCTLSDKLLERAKEELSEDPNTRPIEIKTLRERLLAYPGLNPRVDDAFLLKFLRARKFDQERTFELILNYYNMKKENEDLFAEMTPRHVKHMLDGGMSCLLPSRGKSGEAIFIFRPGKWNPDKYTIQDAFKTVFVSMSVVLESEEIQVTGVRFLDDLEDITWGHVKGFSPSVAKNITGMLQDALPMRLKGLHYIHEPKFFDVIFALVRPLLKEKITSRLFFHGDKVEQLLEFVDAENLPVEYGGKHPSVSTEEFTNHVMKHNQMFEDDNKFGYVSMAMQKKTKKTEDAMENLPGTFKKLNTD